MYACDSSTRESRAEWMVCIWSHLRRQSETPTKTKGNITAPVLCKGHGSRGFHISYWGGWGRGTMSSTAAYTASASLYCTTSSSGRTLACCVSIARFNPGRAERCWQVHEEQAHSQWVLPCPLYEVSSSHILQQSFNAICFLPQGFLMPQAHIHSPSPSTLLLWVDSDSQIFIPSHLSTSHLQR
jgi:hypothetical protein